METYWHKKRLHQLLTANAGTLDEFLDQFAPAIYTWMYYQVGAEDEIALDLTEHTFIRAIEQLPEFQPHQEPFYQWLKEQAKQVRDDGLLHRQMKPQRPWAWSQLSDSVLYSLSRIRHENLPESVCNNQSIQEIVKASLAEMTMQDRKLMMHRYNHLDTPEHIAEEMNIRLEDIEDRLYRCRHSFKRIFVQLISTNNIGFSESNSTVEMEVLDSNLEKLLSATEMNQYMKPAQVEKLRIKLYNTAQDSAATHATVSAAVPKAAIVGLIIGAVAIVIVAGILITVLKNKSEQETPPVSQSTTSTQKEPPKTSPAVKTPSQQKLNDDEIQKVFALGAAGDVDALLEILKSGHQISQITASIFLGQLADPSAIEALNEAEQQWFPAGPADNPFAAAIDAIAKRYPDQVKIIEEELPAEEEAEKAIQPPVQEKPAKATQKKTPELKPTITGEIRTPDNNPVKADIVLIENLSTVIADDGRTLTSVQSDQNGQFKITESFNGLAYLRIIVQTGQQSRIITRSIWGQKDQVNKAIFSERPILFGNVTSNDTPQARQTLYLCDHSDPAIAAYAQQTQTDNSGDFEFWAVPPGVYSIFRAGLDNRLYRLGRIEMPPTEAFSINLPVEPVQAIIELPKKPEEAEDFVDVLEAEIVYGPNTSEKLNQYKGTLTEEDLILFDNVIPGDYQLMLKSDYNAWIRQEVEVVPGVDEQLIEVAALPLSLPEATVAGSFLSASPLPLFLINLDRTIHIDLSPNPEGNYEVVLPKDVYQLAARIEGELVELEAIDLQEEAELIWDIDPAQLLQARTGLYVMTVDEDGFVLSGARIVLNTKNTTTTALTGRHGAFFAAEPGQAQITAILREAESIEKVIEITPGKIPSKPTADNTVLIRFNRRSQ